MELVKNKQFWVSVEQCCEVQKSISCLVLTKSGVILRSGIIVLLDMGRNMGVNKVIQMDLSWKLLWILNDAVLEPTQLSSRNLDYFLVRNSKLFLEQWPISQTCSWNIWRNCSWNMSQNCFQQFDVGSVLWKEEGGKTHNFVIRMYV